MVVTKVQSDYIADYIRGYWRLNQHGPSIRDIAEEYNVSTSTVHRHLMSLIDDGVLTVHQGKARTWRPTVS